MAKEYTCGECRFFRPKSSNKLNFSTFPETLGECARFSPIEIGLRQTPFSTHTYWTPIDILKKCPLVRQNNFVAQKLNTRKCFVEKIDKTELQLNRA